MSVTSISPAEELAAIGWARQDLYEFARWMFWRRKAYRWQRAHHHRILCDALMRVFRGECQRLIINMPPRYSKTELAVVNFVAWALGQVPDAEFIHTSYSSSLAIQNSINIRELVQHPAYADIFPDLHLASHAQQHWKTTVGGVMYATGAGGAITGFGAGKHREGFGGVIIVDDPHKADEARSDVIRQGVIDWFQNTLESRKNSPQTPVIVIMQRLHERDLAGWLLAGGNGEKWEHLCLSAWNEDGSPLWPEKHNAETLLRMEEAAPYMFAGQYRQSPAPPQGGVIKPERIEVIDALPAQRIEWIRAWDLAASTKGDFTVGAKLGRLPDGRYLIADMVRVRCTPEKRDAVLLATAKRDTYAVRISIPQDPGQAGKTQVRYLTRALAGYTVHCSPESGDKITRAMPLAAQINTGNVLMLRGSWNDPLIDEMRLFPNAAHDDQIDALARAFSGLISSNTGMLDWIRAQSQRN